VRAYERSYYCRTHSATAKKTTKERETTATTAAAEKAGSARAATKAPTKTARARASSATVPAAKALWQRTTASVPIQWGLGEPASSNVVINSNSNSISNNNSNSGKRNSNSNSIGNNNTTQRLPAQVLWAQEQAAPAFDLQIALVSKEAKQRCTACSSLTTATLHSLPQRMPTISVSTMRQIDALVQDRKRRQHRNDKYKNLSMKAIRRRQSRELMREQRRTAQQAKKKPSRKHARRAKRVVRNAAAQLHTTKRKIRAVTNTSQTPTKRHKPAHSKDYHMKCYLCGRYKNRCQCFTTGRGKEIARSFQQKIFDKIPPRVKSSDIQTPLDTKDMTAYMRQVQHDMKFEHLWPTAYTWRHFSNEFFWQALMDAGAVPKNAEPNWIKVRNVMRIFQEQGKSWFGGVFYSGNVLAKFRYCDFSAEQPDTLPWIICAQKDMTSIDKEIQSLKLVYYVARSLKITFRQLQRQPERSLWKRATETFMQRISACTQGMFADYSMKIALDGILLSAPQLERIACWWPMLCTAYKQNLPKMYPKAAQTSQNDLMHAGVHFHRQLQKHFSMMKLKCALSQTCWILCRNMR
jgi:hypothetical protein